MCYFFLPPPFHEDFTLVYYQSLSISKSRAILELFQRNAFTFHWQGRNALYICFRAVEGATLSFHFAFTEPSPAPAIRKAAVPVCETVAYTSETAVAAEKRWAFSPKRWALFRKRSPFFSLHNWYTSIYSYLIVEAAWQQSETNLRTVHSREP